MSQTITFTCDLCKGTAVDDNNFLTGIRIQMASAYANSGWADSPKVRKAAWCAPCLAKAGLIHPALADLTVEQVPDPPPTLEQIVRAIVQQEVEALTGAC